MAICLYGSSHQDIFICINHFETFLKIPFLLLSEIIAGKAIMRSLEWPHLSPLQAVHSHQSLWTFIPYLAMRLPPSYSDPTPYKILSQHLVFPPSGDSCSSIHSTLLLCCVWTLCQISQDFLFPHPNDFWIINPLLPLEFSQDFQASASQITFDVKVELGLNSWVYRGQFTIRWEVNVFL